MKDMSTFNQQEYIERDPHVDPMDESPLYSSSKVIYLRKYYLMLTLHYLFMGLLILGITSWQGLANTLQQTSWLLYVVIILLIVTTLAYLIIRKQISRPPLNYVVFFITTLLFAIFGAYMCFYGYSDEVYFIWASLFLISFGQFIYGLSQKQDMTVQGSTLWIVGVIVLVSYWFFLFQLSLSDASIILLAIGVFIWQGFLNYMARYFHVVYDAQTPVSGTHDFGLLDPVSGAILVYSDVFLLFLKLADLIRDSFTKDRH